MKKGFLATLCLAMLFAWRPAAAQEDASPAGPKTVAVNLDSFAVVRYVAFANGSDQTGDGSRQAPWRSLQFALGQITDAAADRRYAILVSRGTYAGAMLQMQPFVDLFGGFEENTWSRDIFAHRTVLSGEGKRRVVLGANQCRLDGFIITAGQVRGNGAGLQCDGVSPSITNNIFIGNKTLAPQSRRSKATQGGAAVYAANGAAPVIEHNIFADNQTEVGGGAGIALQANCQGRIAGNVFIGNAAGLQDPGHSSNGGAISVTGRSAPAIEGNIFLQNQALGENDAGAIFVAHWSAPEIRKNIVVANRSGGQAGALFISGALNSTPSDSIPDESDYYLRVLDNLLVGNANPASGAGSVVFTRRARGLFGNNIAAHNQGIAFRDSEVRIVNNSLFENVRFVQSAAGLAPGVLANNIFWGDLEVQAETSVSHCVTRDGYPGDGNLQAEPMIANDWGQFWAAAANFSAKTQTTEIYCASGSLQKNALQNRVVRAGKRWSVVKQNSARRITVWGDLSGEVVFRVLPTYHLQADSPCIDAGTAVHMLQRDIDGEERLLHGRVDIGADQFMLRARGRMTRGNAPVSSGADFSLPR